MMLCFFTFDFVFLTHPHFQVHFPKDFFNSPLSEDLLEKNYLNFCSLGNMLISSLIWRLVLMVIEFYIVIYIPSKMTLSCHLASIVSVETSAFTLLFFPKIIEKMALKII